MAIEIKTAKSQQVEFPDVSALKGPTINDYQFTIAFNASLLQELVTAMACDKRQVGCTLVFKDKLSPIKVVVGENEGLLMPMKLGATKYCRNEAA